MTTAFAAPDGIKKLRELILTLAMQGKLVDQDPNDPPASDLLKDIEVEKQRLVKEKKIKKPRPLPEIRPEEVPYELPQGWEWVRVWDVAQVITSGSRDWARYYSDSGAIFVTMGNLSKGNYQLRMETTRYVNPPENSEGARAKLQENDLLISITGEVGNLGRIPPNFGEAYINQHTCLLRFMPICRNRYFPELMRSPLAKYQFDAPQRGIKNSFRLGDLGEMIIPLPPLPEQHRIVTKVDQLMTRCDELEKLRAQRDERRLQTHAAAINKLIDAGDRDNSTHAGHFIQQHFGDLYSVKENVAELRKAILQLAVMGRLVSQDPNDPPASELLKEIEVEKKRLVKEKKIKKPKHLPEIKPEEVPYELPTGWEWVRVWDVAQVITSGSRDWARYYSNSGAIFVTMGNLSRGNYQLRMETIRYVQPPENGEGARTKLQENDLLISITGDVGNLARIPPNFGDAYINQHTCLLRFMPICRNRYFPGINEVSTR